MWAWCSSWPGAIACRLLPRGGGTSLAGQTVGEAIVIDFSKYLTRILHFDPEARTVTSNRAS